VQRAAFLGAGVRGGGAHLGPRHTLPGKWAVVGVECGGCTLGAAAALGAGAAFFFGAGESPSGAKSDSSSSSWRRWGGTCVLERESEKERARARERKKRWLEIAREFFWRSLRQEKSDSSS
jgi:hypothetical protein